MACEICQRPTHEWYICPKKPDGYVPLARRQQKESTAALREVQSTNASDVLAGRSGINSEVATEVRGFKPHPLAGSENQASPVDTKPRGRPILVAPTSKRAAYMREYMAKRRLKLKEGE
jgi:hypothetical protein